MCVCVCVCVCVYVRVCVCVARVRVYVRGMGACVSTERRDKEGFVLQFANAILLLLVTLYKTVAISISLILLL